jgi:23S rRNA (uridine2552-2'-O)-methyltransferase
MAQPRKLHDEFFKKAKAEGYVARSAYKLLEIQDRFNLIRRGDRVLDLGCAPGSWMQVAEKLVGDRGCIVGIDLQPVATRYGPRVKHIVGDIFKTSKEDLKAMALYDGESLDGAADSRRVFQGYDVVMSDMAPNTSGHGDDFLSVRLCRRMLELMPGLLRPRGNCAMKVLEGTEFPELLNETRALFVNVKGFKPKSSRDVSRETFIVAEGFKDRGPKEPAAPVGNGIAPAPPKPKPGW